MASRSVSSVKLSLTIKWPKGKRILPPIRPAIGFHTSLVETDSSSIELDTRYKCVNLSCKGLLHPYYIFVVVFIYSTLLVNLFIKIYW